MALFVRTGGHHLRLAVACKSVFNEIKLKQQRMPIGAAMQIAEAKKYMLARWDDRARRSETRRARKQHCKARLMYANCLDDYFDCLNGQIWDDELVHYSPDFISPRELKAKIDKAHKAALVILFNVQPCVPTLLHSPNMFLIIYYL